MFVSLSLFGPRVRWLEARVAKTPEHLFLCDVLFLFTHKPTLFCWLFIIKYRECIELMDIALEAIEQFPSGFGFLADVL